MINTARIDIAARRKVGRILSSKGFTRVMLPEKAAANKLFECVFGRPVGAVTDRAYSSDLSRPERFLAPRYIRIVLWRFTAVIHPVVAYHTNPAKPRTIVKRNCVLKRLG